MHGSHHLDEEYKISASRIGSHKTSFGNFRFFRRSSSLVSESSPACKSNKYVRFFRRLLATILTTMLIALGVVRSVGTPNLIKFSSTLALFSSTYLKPKAWNSKRSVVPGLEAQVHNESDSPRIIEILPKPLHLIIALGGPNSVAKNLLDSDPASILILPGNPVQNLKGNERIQFQNDSTNIFESIAFSWCQSYTKHGRYPTKLIITGPSKAALCSLGRYRWALKIPREIISFKSTNSSMNANSTTTCSHDRSDPFDCTSGREYVRFKYSQMCTDMTPMLLACTNRITMNRALSYNPPWRS